MTSFQRYEVTVRLWAGGVPFEHTAGGVFPPHGRVDVSAQVGQAARFDLERVVEKSRLHPHAVGLVGHSKAGKDTAARVIGKLTHLKYGGSLSWVGLPVVAREMGVTEQEAWEERHTEAGRAAWKRILSAYRREDPARLVLDALRFGQLMIGFRDRAELAWSLRDGLVKHAVWVERPGTPPDPTLDDMRDLCTADLINDGSVEDLALQVLRLVTDLGIPRRG